MTTRISPAYREKEIEIRKMVADVVERGKVEFCLWVADEAGVNATPINAALVNNYYLQLKGISEQYGISQPTDWFSTLMRMPDVTANNEVQELSDEEWQNVTFAISQALENLWNSASRKVKPCKESLWRRSIILRIFSIQSNRLKKPSRKIKARIIDGLKQIPEVEYDKNRLEQELIYYIEKLDISEEKQRLKNHLKYFVETMETGYSQGKKLGFIAQEMGREINTTGSKSNNAEMQNLVVMMKDELEQIKEQVLNVM